MTTFVSKYQEESELPQARLLPCGEGVLLKHAQHGHVLRYVPDGADAVRKHPSKQAVGSDGYDVEVAIPLLAQLPLLMQDAAVTTVHLTKAALIAYWKSVTVSTPATVH